MKGPQGQICLDGTGGSAVEEQQVVRSPVRWLHHELADGHTLARREVDGGVVLDRPPGRDSSLCIVACFRIPDAAVSPMLPVPRTPWGERVGHHGGGAWGSRRYTDRGQGGGLSGEAGRRPAPASSLTNLSDEGRVRPRGRTGAGAAPRRFAESELNATVKRVDRFNFGWDLELSLDGQRVLVEVKGFRGESSSFIITRKELRAARTEADYRVAVVTGLRNGGGSIVIIPGFGSAVDEAQLEPMSWQVADRPSLAHESHTWSQTS